MTLLTLRASGRTLPSFIMGMDKWSFFLPSRASVGDIKGILFFHARFGTLETRSAKILGQDTTSLPAPAP